ncbi:MAG TPA: hypothetical protein VK898_10370 [Chloroflexota bacterium]|nr:hypothetical protein [Chloroflexota bacterium]
MPRFRNGPLEWAVASILGVGTLCIWLFPNYGWLPLAIMGYAAGYYAGRRSQEH